MASEVFEDDNCSSLVSEEDSETQSISSCTSGATSPFDMPAQFLPVTRPRSLDLSSPISLSEFGIFPLLGPRSECSGASSPECEIERGKLDWENWSCGLIHSTGLYMSVFTYSAVFSGAYFQVSVHRIATQRSLEWLIDLQADAYHSNNNFEGKTASLKNVYFTAEILTEAFVRKMCGGLVRGQQHRRKTLSVGCLLLRENDVHKESKLKLRWKLKQIRYCKT